MKRIFDWIDSHRNQARVAVLVGVIGLFWAIGGDVYRFLLPGPVTSTEDNTRRTADAVEVIADGVRASRLDARIVLTSLGYSLDAESFIRAISIGDIDAVRTYCDLSSITLISGNDFFRRSQKYPENSLLELRDCPSFNMNSECKWDGVSFGKSSYRFDDLETVCGAVARRQFEAAMDTAVEVKENERKQLCLEFRDELADLTGNSRVSALIIKDQSDIFSMAPLTFSDGCKLLGVPLR